MPAFAFSPDHFHNLVLPRVHTGSYTLCDIHCLADMLAAVSAGRDLCSRGLCQGDR